MSDTVEILQAPAIVVEIAGPAGPQGPPSESGSGSTSKATATTLGTIKLASDAPQTVSANTATSTANRTYGVQLTGLENAVVNVPWTDTVYTHPASGVTAGTYKSVTVDANGHVTGGTNPTTLAAYGITDAVPSSHVGTGGTAHAVATPSVAGFMSATDKTKLNGLSASYTSEIADAVNSTTVGGATPQAASVWKTRTIVQVLDAVLFPTVAPFILTPKSVSLAFTGTTGVQEVGSVVTRTLTATFNRGRITNGDGQQGPELVGAASSYAFSGTGMGTTISNPTGSLTISPAVISGSNQWSVTATHAAGTGPYTDNKNVASTALDASRAAGTTTGSTAAFTGVYPWYYIKSPISFTAAQFGAAITALGGNTSGAAAGIAGATITRVLASASGTLVVPYNVSNQFFGVAYDNGYTSKTAFFVSSLNSGAITGPFNTNPQSGVNQAATTPLWTNRTFTVHISNNPLTDAAANIELRNL